MEKKQMKGNCETLRRIQSVKSGLEAALERAEDFEVAIGTKCLRDEAKRAVMALADMESEIN